MTEHRRLICFRCVDVDPKAYSVVDKCALCGHAVWRALSSPDGPECICVPCFMQEYTPDAEVEGPTEEQVADVKRFLRLD